MAARPLVGSVSGARRLSAQLGYAWRKAFARGGAYLSDEFEVVRDLHGEALVRLGLSLRPRGGFGQALRSARPEVQEAASVLARLAGRVVHTVADTGPRASMEEAAGHAGFQAEDVAAVPTTEDGGAMEGPAEEASLLKRLLGADSVYEEHLKETRSASPRAPCLHHQVETKALSFNPLVTPGGALCSWCHACCGAEDSEGGQVLGGKEVCFFFKAFGGGRFTKCDCCSREQALPASRRCSCTWPAKAGVP